jgi:hypothetical protein
VTFGRIFGLGVVAAGLVAASCDGDDDSSSGTTRTAVASVSNAASSGAGGGGGTCMGDLTGEAGAGTICDEKADDTECVSCTRMNCCTQIQDCLPDENCRCLLECFLGGCPGAQCLQECGTGMPTQQVITCVSDSCQICLQ